MNQDLSNKKQNFMSRYVQAAQEFLAVRGKLEALWEEWQAKNYASAITQADIQSGGLLHLTPQILSSGMLAERQLNNYMTGQNVVTNQYNADWHALVG